ncbi:MAG: helix-turn-helix transcriptional regulator [Clostridiales Family XIII bacterium]|nr:helix-turn-helix transcriptional regulator [Clostridiales Family XIII bacterium]
MTVINSSKWEQINHMVLLMNRRCGLTEIRQCFLDQLSKIITQSHSLFLLGSMTNGKPNFFAPVSKEIQEEFVQTYIQYFAPLHPLLNQNEDLLSVFSCDADSLRKTYLKSDTFYIDWMLPQTIEYVLSAKISRGDIFYGIISLYRTKEDAPFSDVDAQTLKVLVDHIALKLSLTYPSGIRVHNRIENTVILSKEYGLTFRELDVCHLIYIGYNSNEIGKKLAISEHTVKKHIRSILTKMNVKNRTNLIRILHELNISA